MGRKLTVISIIGASIISTIIVAYLYIKSNVIEETSTQQPLQAQIPVILRHSDTSDATLQRQESLPGPEIWLRVLDFSSVENIIENKEEGLERQDIIEY